MYFVFLWILPYHLSEINAPKKSSWAIWLLYSAPKLCISGPVSVHAHQYVMMSQFSVFRHSDWLVKIRQTALIHVTLVGYLVIVCHILLLGLGLCLMSIVCLDNLVVSTEWFFTFLALYFISCVVFRYFPCGVFFPFSFDFSELPLVLLSWWPMSGGLCLVPHCSGAQHSIILLWGMGLQIPAFVWCSSICWRGCPSSI